MHCQLAQGWVYTGVGLVSPQYHSGIDNDYILDTSKVWVFDGTSVLNTIKVSTLCMNLHI